MSRRRSLSWSWWRSTSSTCGITDMRARLIARGGPEPGKTWIIQDEVTLGRGSENKVRVKNERVSTRHARIFFDPKASAFMLEDLQSRNGTQVAGLYVRGKEK